MIKLIDNIILNSKHGKRFGADARYIESQEKKPVIIFVHGFKGFKDWGHFNLMADYFAENGFVYIKLNLSHNGTSIENPIEFVDPEAFGTNNFSIELDDVGVLIDHLFEDDCAIPKIEMGINKIFLTGHSRGGGLVILKANEDPRVKAIATLASVSTLGSWPESTVKQWKKDGVYYVYNSRTGQNMPLYYQLAEDVQKNNKRLDVPAAANNLKQPMLIIHGSNDESVTVNAAYQLKKINHPAELFIIEDAGHTFGGCHPYNEKKLPEHSKMAVERISEFFKCQKIRT
ncbi:MAG: prolyl oligopeptidase family serine peptidase [Cytophagales bacterium]|nr:prolyl oligopeptidase family serine peptidase [Cytophagales bacterium]